MDNLSRLPRHVSLIMDGNGRWALQRGKERVDGHIEGVNSVREVMKTSLELGIEYISFFAFSEENWNRPEDEVVGLMSLMAKCMANELPTFMKNGVKFVVLGNLDRLDAELHAEINRCMEITSANDRLTLILFLSYSGKWDIHQAAKRMVADALASPEAAEKILNSGLSAFDEYLVTAGIPDPDLIIRTSGETRLSNYLLWQAAYSEFLFVDTLWPDFRKPEFRLALKAYASRDRRYGKVK